MFPGSPGSNMTSFWGGGTTLGAVNPSLAPSRGVGIGLHGDEVGAEAPRPQTPQGKQAPGACVCPCPPEGGLESWEGGGGDSHDTVDQPTASERGRPGRACCWRTSRGGRTGGPAAAASPSWGGGRSPSLQHSASDTIRAFLTGVARALCRGDGRKTLFTKKIRGKLHLGKPIHI